MNRFDYQFPVRIHFGQGCFEDSLRHKKREVTTFQFLGLSTS